MRRAAHEGCYSIDFHLRHDPTATEVFAETHGRRLEAMRRAGTGIERDADGGWTIGADHLARMPPPGSTTNLRRECRRRSSGFGAEVRGALAARRQRLVEQQLAESDGKRDRMRAHAALMLQRRELLGEGARLSGELGKTFTESHSCDAIDGMLTSKIELESGKFALVEEAETPRWCRGGRRSKNRSATRSAKRCAPTP